MTRETVTTLTMKTAANAAKQSEWNAAARAEIAGLKEDIAKLTALFAQVNEVAAAKPMQAKNERNEWNVALAELQEEFAPTRWFAPEVVRERIEQLKYDGVLA